MMAGHQQSLEPEDLCSRYCKITPRYGPRYQPYLENYPSSLLGLLPSSPEEGGKAHIEEV